jgi:hypothetical protein
MSTFIVSIFSNEAKAYEAVHAFNELHVEGSISLYDTTVVQRQSGGLEIKQKAEMQEKLEALEDQAKKAKPEVKTEIEQHIAELRKDFTERERKLSHAFELAQQALQP